MPIGWLQITGHESASALAYELAWPGGAIVFPVPGQAGIGTYAVETQPHLVFELLESWMRERLFDVVVIDPFDAISPPPGSHNGITPRSSVPDRYWGSGVNHRAHWIGRQVVKLRPLIFAARATIVAVCHSRHGGGRQFQAAIDVRLRVGWNGRVMASGRALPPGSQFMIGRGDKWSIGGPPRDVS